MAPQELLMDLIVRAIFLSMPVAVGVLAFRRMLMSQTVNVWLYALTVGYTAFVAMGLMPWAMGLHPVSAVFVILAVICPAIWLGIVVACGLGRQAPYDVIEEAVDVPEPAPAAPLLLTNPVLPEPVPIFRHHRRKVEIAKITATDVVDVARAMRGRASSEARRVRKLLPPPSPEARDLPFLR